MRSFNCPSCGAAITFQSSVSVSCVCPYCRSLVVRRDMNVEALGKMAELPDDISVFQIGTTGTYRGKGFTLVGRMKIGWKDGAWNEWFIATDDGKKGWLAEAQGFLSISFEEPVADGEAIAYDNSKHYMAVDKLPGLGNYLMIGETAYIIADIIHAECLGSEGELPLVAPQGRKTVSVDLLGRNSEFAGLEYEDGKVRRYIGSYVRFDDLRFSNLRELPGWRVTRTSSKAAQNDKQAHDGR